MPEFIHRRRDQICKYQTPREKEKRYTNHVHPSADSLKTPYDLFLTIFSLGRGDLLYLPEDYSIIPDTTSRQFIRYGRPLRLFRVETDFVEQAKRVLNMRHDFIPRGLSWRMGDGTLAVYPLVCALDGVVLYEAFEGDMAEELFQFQGLPRERIRASPNYRENNIVCRVPSRSLRDVKVHLTTIHNPSIKDTLSEWWHTVLRHQCGDTTYNRELNVGVGQIAIEEHDVAGFMAAGIELVQRGTPLKSNFVLPFTREAANTYKTIVNQVVKLDRVRRGPNRGKTKVRNLREGEREWLFETYISIRRGDQRFRAGDRLLLDSFEELQRELRRDNYILEILYPS